MFVRVLTYDDRQRNRVKRCVLVLTTHGGGSPVHRDAVLTAFVCIRCNAGAQTFTVPPTVAVAGVR